MIGICRSFMWALSLAAIVTSMSALVILVKILRSFWKSPELVSENIMKFFKKPIILMCAGSVSAFASIILFIYIL